jgi:hypothetical protein
MSAPVDGPGEASGHVELRTRRPHSIHLLGDDQEEEGDDHIGGGSFTAVAAKPRPASHGGTVGSSTVPVGGGGELMLLMYVLGGREVGQVTVFRRPLSVWRLDLTRL